MSYIPETQKPADPITASAEPFRPLIFMDAEQKIKETRKHADPVKKKITMTRHNISFGCTDIEPEVILYLADQYKQHFSTVSILIQDDK